jgi:hypothetical protein
MEPSLVFSSDLQDTKCLSMTKKDREIHNKGISQLQTNNGGDIIWGAFQAIGFELAFDTKAAPYRLLFNEEKLRESADFRELW